MKLSPLAPLALAAGALAFSGCESQSSYATASSAPTSTVSQARAVGSDYTFVFLLAGPNDGQLEPEELKVAREGHFENMQRLAQEGVLLLAGPLTEPRSDEAHRGVFLFDVDDVEEARAIAATDPGVVAGVFELAVYPFRSPSDLRRVLQIEQAAQEAHDPEAPAVDTRPYVLASADDASALRVVKHLEYKGQAFFYGVFGGELEGTTLVALDALRKEAAQELLEEAAGATDTAVDWTLHGWFSTDSIEALAEHSAD